MDSINKLTFADLLLTEEKSVFRYLEGQNNPIVNVDSYYDDEIKQIKSNIKVLSQSKGKEFFYSHFGTPYRVTVINTVGGTGYFLRKLKIPVPALDQLGFSAGVLSTLKSLGKMKGLILVGGATGSGKSTTIYSLLTEFLTQYGDILISIEDPPELPAQGSYGADAKGIWYQLDARDVGGYEQAMISAMRYNPRYIFLGEIRSPKTAKEAIRAAVNGHLVVSTIHGSSVQGSLYALQQIASAEGEMDLVRSIIADGLLCVIHQELHFIDNGNRKLTCNILCNDGTPSIPSKIRSGKLELLNNEIETQKILLSRGNSLVK